MSLAHGAPLMGLWRNTDLFLFPKPMNQKQLKHLKDKRTSVLLKERCLKSPKLRQKKLKKNKARMISSLVIW